MSTMIVHSSETITLIGGGPIEAESLDQALALGPRLVAADGGAGAALAAGHMPEAVIGDLDSLRPDDRARIPAERIHQIDEQDSTDFDKCLSRIAAPLILGLGFTGARLDHQLAAYNALVRHNRQRCILIGEEEVILLAPPSLRLNLPAGTVVSLFPMGAVEATSEGLQWPLRGINFAPDGPVGTSNRATGPVWLAMTAPKMLLILPRSALTPLVETLLARPYGWG